MNARPAHTEAVPRAHFRRMLSGRMIATGIAALLLLAIMATSAAAAGPVRSKGGGFDFVAPAGLFCPFTLHWVADDTHMNVLTFPVQANGDQLTLRTGHAAGSSLTYVDTGASLVVPESYKLTQITHADGTMDWYIDGSVVIGTAPTDVGGPYLRLYKGNLHFFLDAQSDVLGYSFDGTYVDLCAALGS